MAPPLVAAGGAAGSDPDPAKRAAPPAGGPPPPAKRARVEPWRAALGADAPFPTPSPAAAEALRARLVAQLEATLRDGAPAQVCACLCAMADTLAAPPTDTFAPGAVFRSALRARTGVQGLDTRAVAPGPEWRATLQNCWYLMPRNELWAAPRAVLARWLQAAFRSAA